MLKVILSAVDANEIWFKHVGNDLVATVMGSQDTITIAGWYSNNYSKLSYSKLSAVKIDAGPRIDSGL
jgi:hypothetical protein